MRQARKAGLLRVSTRNPRYFETADTGRIVYLTGSHTWNSFQDTGADIDGDGIPDYIRGQETGFEGKFDYPGYLEFLTRNGHNFIRLWMWEHARWGPWSAEDNYWISPLPYKRTGSGTALDGLGKFDLDQFDPVFFERLRERVALAEERGIYASVMLFGGGSIGNKRWPGDKKGNPWHSHPYHAANNVNGIDGDTDGDGQGWEVREVKNEAILDLQKAYIRKVVDTLNGYDNLLYELSNEDPFNSYRWHYEMIRYIKAYEATKPKQHPVGMTIAWSMDNERLLESPADWISPSHWEHDLTKNPVNYDGNAGHEAGPKVLIADTDHIFFGPTTLDFTWKAFCRGHNVISMEHSGTFLEKDAKPAQFAEMLQCNAFATLSADRYQNDTRRFADRIDLASAIPEENISSTGYCLAAPGSEYLIFHPSGGPFEVKLTPDADIQYAVEWFDPAESRTIGIPAAIGGGGIKRFEAPFAGPAVLYLKKI